MARILISCSSPLEENGAPTFVCMYEGLFRALEQAGNQVLVINVAFLVTRAWNGTNELLPHIDAEKLVDIVRAFAAELTIAFNHAIPAPVLEMLECPIVLWDGDSVQFFNDKHVILANIARYHFFCFSRHGMQNHIEFGAPADRVFFMPAGTAVEAQPIAQDKNISFIGTMFQNPPTLKDFLHDYESRQDRDRIIDLVRQGYENIHDPFIVERREQIEKYVEISHLFSMYSPQRRIDVLNMLGDLGLTIYGGAHWLTLAQFFPDIAAAYDATRIYSLKHNQDVYNSSRLCLNISHTQVVDGYAWRVLDVMASNGCLLSDRQKGIADLLRGYIDLPMFDTMAEARDLAKRLLRDEPHRRAIVEASQRCVEDKGRWKHRFAEMESILSVKLLHDDAAEKGSVSFLPNEIYYPPAQPVEAPVEIVPEPIQKNLKAQLSMQAKHAIYMMLPPVVSGVISRHRRARRTRAA